MSAPNQQDLAFIQSGQKQFAFDSSVSAVSVPRRAADYRSWSLHLRGPVNDDGTATSAKGTAQVFVSNAPFIGGLLVGSAAWVAVDELKLDIGGADSCPSLLRCLFNDIGWVVLKWTPGSGSSGLLAAWFDGVRR